jgi:hypothetical protein
MILKARDIPVHRRASTALLESWNANKGITMIPSKKGLKTYEIYDASLRFMFVFHNNVYRIVLPNLRLREKIVRNNMRKGRMDTLLKNEHMEIRREVLGPYGTNTYIVICRRTGESIVVDAPARPAAMVKLLEGTVPKYILLTHNHEDHTGALKKLKSMLGVPFGAMNWMLRNYRYRRISS